jgi:uncharacterized protein (PEP-CTERM system associated)
MESPDHNQLPAPRCFAILLTGLVSGTVAAQAPLESDQQLGLSGGSVNMSPASPGVGVAAPLPGAYNAPSNLPGRLGGEPVDGDFGEGGPRSLWSFTARAEGAVTYTDNATLAPPGQEEADLVLSLRTPLLLRREGRRLRCDAEYVPTYYLYTRDAGSDELQNYLRASLLAEAIEDLFFVDAAASIDQTYISPFAPRPESGLGTTDNRTEQAIFRLSPYLASRTGRGWQYLIRNDAYWNTYSDSSLDDSFVNRAYVNVGSPEARLRTEVDYTYLYTKFESDPDSNYQQIGRVRPILAVTPRLSVGGRLGYESNDYDLDDYSGAVYGAEFKWVPTPRTKLDGFIEHRFFGTSYELDLRHRSRRTVWRLGGTRNTYTPADQPSALRPGTTAELLDDAFRSRYPDPEQRRDAVDEFLETAGVPLALPQPYGFYTNQVYVAEQWGGSFALIGRRNTIELALFWQENESISDTEAGGSTAAASDRFRQKGGRLLLSRRLSSFSTVAFTGSRLYSRQIDGISTSSALKSTEDALRVSLTRRLGPKTDGSIGVRWSDFDSDTTEYRETAVFATVAHTF